MLCITIGLNEKNFTFLRIEKKAIYLTEDLSWHVFMDMKLEHASIIGKKIRPFARTVMEIFNFYFGKLSLGHPVYGPKVTISRKN